MKKFIIRIVWFIFILFVIDRVMGFALSYMSNNAKGGYVNHYNYIINKTNEDVLIFGSSRAIHHYNPQIIEDSLQTSCFNCGQEGSGIIQNYGFWSLIKDRYKPKIVIYDIMDEFDLLLGADNHKYLGWLKESYDRKDISEIFETVDKTEKYKMFCMMYRYNSKWHQIIGDYIHPVYKVKEKGFIPLEGEMDTMKIVDNFNINYEFAFDPIKIFYLKKLVEEMGNTTLVFVVSPSWYGMSPKHFEPIESISKEYGILFLNYANDQRFVHVNEYFKDGGHLNSKGADFFTQTLMNDLTF